MEFLTSTVSFDIFKDNYFTSFCPLPTLELTTSGQKVCSTKIGYANVLSLGTNSCRRKERDHFEQRSAGKAKTQCNLCGYLKQQQNGVHSFFSILST